MRACVRAFFHSRLTLGRASDPLPFVASLPSQVDPSTGELHYFSCNLYQAPYLHYGVLDAEGSPVKTIPIAVPSGPVMMHDMALTSKYAIFLYMPLFFRPMEMINGQGFPFIFDSEAPAKFGLLPRSAQSDDEMRWFDLPASMIFHTVNAWDDPNGTDVVSAYTQRTTRTAPKPTIARALPRANTPALPRCSTFTRAARPSTASIWWPRPRPSSQAATTWRTLSACHPACLQEQREIRGPRVWGEAEACTCQARTGACPCVRLPSRGPIETRARGPSAPSTPSCRAPPR